MVKTILQTETFPGRPEALYDLYLDPKKHAAAIGGDVKVSRKIGAAFSAWDDYCKGKILHLEPGRIIVQTRRASDWKKTDPDSILILTFEKSGKSTELRMVHANVPDAHAASLDNG